MKINWPTRRQLVRTAEPDSPDVRRRRATKRRQKSSSNRVRAQTDGGADVIK